MVHTVFMLSPGWQIILPKRPLKEEERQQVAAYYKLGTHSEVTLRSNIITNLDTMVLEIKREGSNKEPTRLINIYNQKPLGNQPQTGWTIDRLIKANIDPATPIIITGDWNIRHPDWDNGVETPCPRTRETLEWIVGNGFSLCNEPFIPTREDSAGHSSVIDLTFKNAAANRANLISSLYVDMVIGALSDHHAIIFNIGDLEEVVFNKTSYNLNWKHADESKFREALKTQLGEEMERHTHLVSNLLKIGRAHV